MTASIFSFASGKGGVGKTLVTASVGIKLARKGYRVLLIDGDMGLRNMDLVFGLENECLYNICDVADGKCFFEDAVLSVIPGLQFLPASPGESWDDIFPSSIDTVLEDLNRRYDYILIDCPAGMGKGIEAAFRISERIFCVVVPSWASKRNGDNLVSMIPGRKAYSFILNQFSASDDTKLSLEEMLETVDPEYLGGVLPYSREVDRLAHHGRLSDFNDYNAFGQSLDYLLRGILEGKEFPESKWNSLLESGDCENEKDMQGNRKNAKKSGGLSWNSTSRVYRWHRRR